MEDPRAPLEPNLQLRRRRAVVFCSVFVICLLGALAVKARLNHYSDPGNFDPSPIPRPTRNAPFIVTPDKVVDAMVELGEISADEMVYDLGCGDGRLVITAAMKTGCQGVGFDIDPQRVKEATENAKLHDVDKLVQIKLDDVFKVDLSEADVVLMYLLPQMLRDLIPQFNRCQPGTRLLSHDFLIEGIKVDKTVEVHITDTERHWVHLYVTPLQKLPPTKPLKSILN